MELLKKKIKLKKDIIVGKCSDAARLEELGLGELNEIVVLFGRSRVGRGRPSIAIKVQVEPMGYFDLEEDSYEVGAFFFGNIDNESALQKHNNHDHGTNDKITFTSELPAQVTEHRRRYC